MLAVNLGTRGAGRRAQPASNTATIPAAPSCPTCAASTAGRSRTTSSSGASATRWTAPGRWSAKTATEYGRVATEAAKMMTLDRSRRSSSPPAARPGRNMPTFGAWEDEVLEHTFDHVEFISLHTYLNNYADDTPAFLASPDLMDSFIEEVVAIADAVAARAALDQAHHAELRRMERLVPHAPQARRPGEAGLAGRAADPRGDLHDGGRAGLRRRLHLAAEPCRPGEDRLPGAAGQRHRADHDRDRRAGLAADDLLALRRFQPSRPRPVLRAEVESPTYAASYYDPRGTTELCIPDAGGALSEAGGGARTRGRHADAVRAQPAASTEEMPLEVLAKGFPDHAVTRATTLHNADLTAVNTLAAPDRIKPAPLEGAVVEGERVRVSLPPASWSVLRLEP